MGLKLQPRDLHLTGIITEEGYEGESHWLLFLFEVKPRLKEVPPTIREGSFAFHSIPDLSKLELPKTESNRSGRYSGDIAADFLRRIADVWPTAKTIGRLKRKIPSRAV